MKAVADRVQLHTSPSVCKFLTCQTDLY